MTSYRTHARIRKYLADWMADRALVHTDLHRAQVDRIYMADPVVKGYRVGWDCTAQTPYAYRGGTWLFPFGTPGPTAAAIALRNTSTSPCTSTSLARTH